MPESLVGDFPKTANLYKELRGRLSSPFEILKLRAGPILHCQQYRQNP